MAIPAALRQELDGIPILDDPGSLRMRSRDFFWFSPILKEMLEHKRAAVFARPWTPYTFGISCRRRELQTKKTANDASISGNTSHAGVEAIPLIGSQPTES